MFYACRARSQSDKRQTSFASRLIEQRRDSERGQNGELTNWLTDWLSVCVCAVCAVYAANVWNYLCDGIIILQRSLFIYREGGGGEKSSLERYGHSFDVLCRNRKQLQKSPFSPTNETEINKKPKTIQTTKLAIGICIKCATYTVLHNWGQEVLQRKPYREDRYTQRSSSWRFTIES